MKDNMNQDEFVACRSEKNSEQYDIVIGGFANDKVLDTIQGK